MAAADPRRAAVIALQRVHMDGGYSQLVLDTLLKETAFSPADKALLSRLFYGVLERRLTLDYLIGKCASMPLKKMHPQILELLRIGIYQLLYMDRIPDAAAVYETVKLTRGMGQMKATGFVNAVLREIGRRKEKNSLFDDLPEGSAGESIRYSVSVEWIDRWKEQYGEEITAGLLQSLDELPPQSLRINTALISVAEFQERLRVAEVPFAVADGLPDSIQIPAGFDWKRVAKIEENWYYYQDTASQYDCLALGALPGERIADVCAAPGGKSFTLALMMQNEGYLLASDLYPKKCDMMSRRAKTLGLTMVDTAPRDAAGPLPTALIGSFDRVMCDAPCSGLGVIRRKPEIREKSLADVASLPDTQWNILCRAAELVKPGGVLQYSTCTLNKAENEEITARFLAEHPDFDKRILPLVSCFEKAGLAPSHEITLFPHLHGTDGFYIASFTRKG